MRQLLRVMGACLLLAAALACPAEAVSTLRFRAAAVPASKGEPARARIYVGGEAVMTISGHGWKTLAVAQEVASRLNALAEDGARPEDIGLWAERKAHVLVARGERLVTVDKAVAASQGSEREGLARLWLKNLRAQFAKPYLSVAPILVPLGETRPVVVKGNIAGQLAVDAETPMVRVTWDETSREIRVLGAQVGRTELVVQDGASVLRVPVRVAKYAARLLGAVVAQVTGNPAPPSVVEQAVRAALGASLALEPGAFVSLTAQREDLAPLWLGRTARVRTVVSVSGPEYLPFYARPTVEVLNEAISQAEAQSLMVSNSPERLAGHGLWFEGKISGGQPARLLYHHVNASRGAADLVVELWNLGEAMARVQVVAGTAGPSQDEAYVGHRAAAEFLSRRAGGEGWVVPIAARTAAPVVSQRLPAGAVASGVIEFRPLSAADLRVRVYLAPSLSLRFPRLVENYAESPLLGRWQYSQTRREISARYQVGREWAFITIGDQPLVGASGGDLLAGAYGVIHDIALELTNPTALPAQVDLYLEPAGGPARAAVLVDGVPVETAMLRRHDEGTLARYRLGPGQTRRVRLQTMPQGGSNYPVRLVARAP